MIHLNAKHANDMKTAGELYAAINRNDVLAALNCLAPDIERIEPESFPPPRMYRGHAELKAHITKGREAWEEGSCAPEQFMVTEDKVIVFLFVKVKLKNNPKLAEGRLADVLTFRDGKIIEMRTFENRQQALEWAGVVL